MAELYPTENRNQMVRKVLRFHSIDVNARRYSMRRQGGSKGCTLSFKVFYSHSQMRVPFSTYTSTYKQQT